MSLAYYIVLNPEIAGFDAYVNGKALTASHQFEAEQWFSGENGLATVHALSKYLAENPKALKSANAIGVELAEYAKVLERTKKEKARWHLAVDF